MPATPSANTIGIESRIRATKTAGTVASSMKWSVSVLGIALWQPMHDHREREMRARLDSDGCADQRQPRQRELADFLDPGERHRVDIEPVGDGADEITQDDADQAVDDRKGDQRRDREFRDG